MIFSLFFCLILGGLIINSFFNISLSTARRNVFRLQKRIFKCIFIGDFVQAFRIQKILLTGNSARFLAIRYVTQNKFVRFFPDSKMFPLNLVDKFKLNQYILDNLFNWKPQKGSLTSFFKSDFSSSIYSDSWSIFDYCWQCLVKFALEPAQEALFSPRNFGFRYNQLVYSAQKLVIFNLGEEAFGVQKRILKIQFEQVVRFFDYDQFFKKLFIPRFIKLGVFRFLKLGFVLRFQDDSKDNLIFNSLLANVLLNGIELLFNSLRFGSNMIIFLRPFDDEIVVLNKVKTFLLSSGIDKV